MDVNAGAVRATRPYVTASARAPEGWSLRFGVRDDTIFAFVVVPEEPDAAAGSAGPDAACTVPGVAPRAPAAVELVGAGRPRWSAAPEGVRVELPPRALAAHRGSILTIALSGFEARG